MRWLLGSAQQEHRDMISVIQVELDLLRLLLREWHKPRVQVYRRRVFRVLLRSI